MGKIGVHFYDIVSPHIQRHPESCSICRPQAKFSGTMDNSDPVIGSNQLIGQLARAVRRIVINKQNVKGRMLLKYLPGKTNDIITFIKGRNDDDCFQMLLISGK